jgi:hypothetical protein
MKTKLLPFLFIVLFIALAIAACNTAGNRQKPEPFTVDTKARHTQIGEIEVQYDDFFSFSGLKKMTVPVSYVPEDDAVCLHYRNNMYDYQSFWSRDGRDAFVAALARYNEDFEARNLPDKGTRRNNRAYNTIQGYLIWQIFAFSTLSYASVTVDLGYDFKQRSPYFTANQRETKFIDPVSPQDPKTGDPMTFYFTRTQAEELIKLFDQEYLDGLALGRNVRNNAPADTDEY